MKFEAAGHGLKITVEIQVGHEKPVPADVEKKLNAVLAGVKDGWGLE